MQDRHVLVVAVRGEEIRRVADLALVELVGPAAEIEQADREANATSAPRPTARFGVVACTDATGEWRPPWLRTFLVSVGAQLTAAFSAHSSGGTSLRPERARPSCR